ncbi:MAG: GTP cyclohydrolase I FolE2 [Candidatus Lokiarchaeota archaeon]|nr:GTP cyclohydrolase I FolE2 [Candidatus Lokiarchaeota archaeon]
MNLISELPDIQNETSGFVKLKINKVGITNVRSRVKIRYNHKEYEFTPMISAVVELPSIQRGTHMSRNTETIEEVIDEISHKPAGKIEGITKNMALKLLEKHEYTSRVEVKLKGILVMDVFQERKGKVQKSIEIEIKTIGDRNENNNNLIKHYLTITTTGMIACPCGQELSRDYAKAMLDKRKKEFNLDDNVIEDILNLVPMATHSQRCIGTIMIEIPHDYEVELLDLMEIIEKSMSGITYNILKRPDEGKLIRYSHLNPRFVEDCIRIMALKIYNKYKAFPDNAHLNLKVESQESIHSHNAVAEIDSTIGKLRQNLEKE